MFARGQVRIIARFAALAILASILPAGGMSRGPAAASAAPSARSRASSAGPTDPEVASFVRLMNAHRVSRGLSPLIWDNRLAAVAKAHSQDMLDRGYFSHTTPDGRTTWDRLAARDIVYSRAGENIAWGQRTGRAVLRAWLKSRGHRENIEQGAYTRHGVGRVGPYWTHVFIRPKKGT